MIFAMLFLDAPGGIAERDARACRLKQTVTAGNWPKWFTVSGPMRGERVWRRESSGTSLPELERM